jgi:hypothetical protein
MLYNELQELFANKKLSNALIEKGVIGIDVVSKFQMYEYYCTIYCNDRRNRTTALKATALKYKCSVRTATRSIAYMLQS